MNPRMVIPISEVCYCVKCTQSQNLKNKEFTTSGIPDTNTGERVCPLCKSMFIGCPICLKNSSSTKRFGVIVCDSCKYEFANEPPGLLQPENATDVILSGMRATGRLHFGNFMGAIRHFIEYQRPGNVCMYFIADLHTLTTSPDSGDLQRNLMDIATDYLAAGLDPESSIIYVQSSVPEITELATYLSMIQPMGELTRIPTFKELVRKQPDNVNLGLLSYPVLMAADILAPQATIVPVGSDQIPNIELARTLARKFNEKYGNILRVPKFPEVTIKVPGLNGEKMGKSEGDNSVPVSSSRSEIQNLYLRKGITDINRKTATDPGDPEKCLSVYPLHKILGSIEDAEEISHKCKSGTIGCVECKKRLVGKVADLLEPFQERRKRFENDQDYVRDVLHYGGIKARSIIRKTVESVRSYMGIKLY